MAEDAQGKIPILLLKTKSSPVDSYEEYFASFNECRFEPIFVPVLEHRFKTDTLEQVRLYITSQSFIHGPEHGVPSYGAIIFTSQRAVEAFAQVVEGIRNQAALSLDELLPVTLPFYVVGPATARGLRALNIQCPILGEETGNGDVLASFILEHYNTLYPGVTKPPLLFLVGDKRRDIIPKTLQSEHLPSNKRLEVNELEVYETGEMQSFRADFTSIWRTNANRGAKRQWVVVFSPQGCKAMLESLDIVEQDTGKAKRCAQTRSAFIATIGPTTRDYLIKEFDFSPDVCAEKPSPEGIATGIQSFSSHYT